MDPQWRHWSTPTLLVLSPCVSTPGFPPPAFAPWGRPAPSPHDLVVLQV
jgi:hypothetical protein